jgi:hypothetical protein
MKKLILAFTLGFTPFLSLAFNNLFDNPNLQFGSPKGQETTSFDCQVSYNGIHTVLNGSSSGVPTQQYMLQHCQGAVESWLTANASLPYGCPVTRTEWSDDKTIKLFHNGSLYCNAATESFLIFTTQLTPPITESLLKCPPDSNPEQTYQRDSSGDGNPDQCFDPNDLDLLDDCNASSGNEILDVAVSSPKGCFEQEDGSICAYTAVTTMSGHEYYAMDLEGSCYQEDVTSLNGSPDGLISEVPTASEGDFACVDNSGLFTCSESESVYADLEGIPDEGCGTVGGAFACVSGDIDGDTIPDYLDPDVDGDGVRNDDDIDADGDGKDDVIKRDSNQSSAAVVVNVDVSDIEINLEPVVKELVEIKDLLSKSTVEQIQAPTQETASFYESEYEDGVQGIWEEFSTGIQQTEMNTFLETFKNVPSGGTLDNSMCFDLGSMGNYGCGSLSANPMVWGAIRIFILVTAGFLCRRIVFGG